LEQANELFRAAARVERLVLKALSDGTIKQRVGVNALHLGRPNSNRNWHEFIGSRARNDRIKALHRNAMPDGTNYTNVS